MSTLYANAHIWGITGSLSKMSGTSIDTGVYGKAIINQMGHSPAFDFIPLVNQQSELIGGTVIGKRLEVDITFTPIGGSSTNSVAAVNTLLALMSSSVSTITLSNCEDTRFNSDFSIISPMQVSYSSNDRASISLQAVKYDSITPASLATIVT